MKPISSGEKKKGDLSKSALVSIAFELGFIIALPVVGLGFLGKWLDAKTGTYPVLTLIGILGAIVATSFWMYRKFRGYFK